MKPTVFWAFILAFLLPLGHVWAQSGYADSIYAFRQAYKEDFIKEKRSPLKEKDTAFLCFYAPDKHYRVLADLDFTLDVSSFEMNTHSGKTQAYRNFAIASFYLKGRKYKVHIYKSIRLSQDPKMASHLFLPFNDLTNYETTYGGGRYIDLDEKDIKDNKLWIDFNKCYNPYCAFSEGYSCPIPPVENRLKVRIEAGERLFGRDAKE